MGIDGCLQPRLFDRDFGPCVREIVDRCLDLMGPLSADQDTHGELVDHASDDGDLTWGSESEIEQSTQRVTEMLQLVVSLRDYQYA